MRLAILSLTIALLALALFPIGAKAEEKPTTQPAIAPNTLTDAEKTDGWKLLFDGKTTAGWRGFKKDKCPDGWQVVDGILDRVKRGGDLITTEQYESFDLILDWRISKAGNSGVMYHVTEDDDRAAKTGPECQIEDNTEAHDPELSGWCYALYHPPIDPKTGKPLDTTKPPGEWNTMRILIDGTHVEHWMNGVKYVEFELWSDDWNARVAKTKFAGWPNFAKAKSGHIALQDHGDEVAFRNIKIKPLVTKKGDSSSGK